jgi:arsenite transporter
VLIWNDLARGDADYYGILVAFNSVLQMVLYAPFAIFYVKVVHPGDEIPDEPNSDDVDLSYSLVAQSVAVFLGSPKTRAE